MTIPTLTVAAIGMLVGGLIFLRYTSKNVRGGEYIVGSAICSLLGIIEIFVVWS